MKDGGPAFPHYVTAGGNGGSGSLGGTGGAGGSGALVSGGMSLRDYFAAMAMQGFRSSEGFRSDCKEIARYSYMQANAMLAERDK